MNRPNLKTPNSKTLARFGAFRSHRDNFLSLDPSALPTKDRSLKVSNSILEVMLAHFEVRYGPLLKGLLEEPGTVE